MIASAPEQRARRGEVAVVLAQVHAVGADRSRPGAQSSLTISGTPAARHSGCSAARLLARAAPASAVLLRYCRQVGERPAAAPRAPAGARCPASSGVIRYRPRRGHAAIRWRDASEGGPSGGTMPASTATAFYDSDDRRRRHRLPHLDVRRLRLHLRRGEGPAGRRHRAGHALGRRARTPGPARIAA